MWVLPKLSYHCVKSYFLSVVLNLFTFCLNIHFLVVGVQDLLTSLMFKLTISRNAAGVEHIPLTSRSKACWPIHSYQAPSVSLSNVPEMQVPTRIHSFLDLNKVWLLLQHFPVNAAACILSHKKPSQIALSQKRKKEFLLS